MQGNLNVTIRVKSSYNPIPDPSFASSLAKYTVRKVQPKRAVQDSLTIDPANVTIHGLCSLVPGYDLPTFPTT
jgi:hypothetical protein